MLNDFRFLLKDNWIKYPIITSGALILAQIVMLFFGIKQKSEPISLHYTTYLGVDFIGAWYLTFLLPLASIVFVILNVAVARMTAKKNKMLGYIAVAGAGIAVLLFFVQTIFLIRLN